MKRFAVVLTQGMAGYVVAECPALPGCVSQGRTTTDAMRNIKEAALLYLDALSSPERL